MSRLVIGLKRAVPMILGVMLLLFGAEALRNAGAPPVFIDAGLIFCGVMLARFFWGISKR